MKLNKLILILCINALFSQGNYQLLTVPCNFNDMFKTNHFIQGDNISFFHLMYPNDINLSSVSIPFSLLTNNPLSKYHINFSYLNYGKLIDSQNNYSFYPDEAFISINKFKKYNNINILFSAGYMISSIDIYSSSTITTNIFISIQDIKKEILFGIKNAGYVIDGYTGYDTDLPTSFQVNFLRKFNPIAIQLNYEKRLDFNHSTFTFLSKIHFNEKLDFYLSTNTNRADLLYGDYIDKIAVATSFGLSYNNQNNVISLGMQNLGAAGYSTSIYFEKINL